MNEIKANTKRIHSIDVIRGFAILGILIMNIQSFSMIGSAYMNPTAYGDLTGANKWVWIVSHVFADQKFMTIFSMLFGASILIITEGIEQKGGTSIAMHYRRNAWLLLLGLIHAYLIWYGDILAPYAVIAFVMYPLRKMTPRRLLIIGSILFSISSIGDLFLGFEVQYWPDQAIEQLSGFWQPGPEQVSAEVTAYQGDISSQLAQRFKTAFMMHTYIFPNHLLWRISGLMLIGMALYRSGFLRGASSSKAYVLTLLIGGISGYLLVIYGVLFNFEANWTIKSSMFLGSQFNYWGSLGVALAYISGVTLVCRSRLLPLLTDRLAAVGKTALSNYILQSILCTSIFYGFGLGWFGKVDRLGQIILVLAIWILQLIISPLWLKYFRFGPLEWVWRSLSQGKVQPMLHGK